MMASRPKKRTIQQKIEALEKEKELTASEQSYKKVHSLIESSAASAATPLAETPAPPSRSVTPLAWFEAKPAAEENAEEKAAARRERKKWHNRISARSARERRKAHIVELEETIIDSRTRVATMKAYAATLRSKLKEADTQIQDLKIQLQFANEGLGLDLGMQDAQLFDPALSLDFGVVTDNPLEVVANNSLGENTARLEDAGVASPRWG